MRMETLYVSREDFNNMTEKELECFALVSCPTDDQYVSTWQDIINSAYEVALGKDPSIEEDNGEQWLREKTNSELLDEYFDNDADINGNNHEILFAKIVDGIPKIHIYKPI
jgi:hypothetical protein